MKRRLFEGGKNNSSGGFSTIVSKWCDDWRMAGRGILFFTQDLRFFAVFVPVFVIFGTLLSMFSSGFSAFSLFFATDFDGKMGILGSAFLALFGVGRSFWDFLLNFVISLLQALLITLIVLVYRHRRNQDKQKRTKNKPSRLDNKQKRNSEKPEAESGFLQNAGLSAGLALLGSGCPTCGTTLITPILSALFSGGSLALAGTISGIITAVAILIALWSIKKLGVEAYAIIVGERWRNKKQRQKKEENEKVS